MKNKRLLVASFLFPNKTNSYYKGVFVKEQLKYLKDYFCEITDISPIPRSFGLEKEDRVCKNYQFGNVKVFFPRYFHLPIEYFRKRLGDSQYKATNALIEKEKTEFDLIHAHFVWPSGYVAAKLKEKYKVPLVVTAHGFDIYDVPFRNTILKKKVEYTLNSADYIITVSNSNLKYINKLNIKTSVEIIPNGFNKKLFYPMDSRKCRELLELPLNKKIILTVGNLVEVKGHKYLIRAIKEILKQRKDIMCIIIGSGGLKGELNELIKRLGLEAHIRLVGAKPHEEIPLWMNACDVFVFPSLKESFGIVQIEALACGKPIVATYNGGSEEIIKNEKLGILTEPKNPKGLKEALNKTLEKEIDIKEIKKYAEQFTWDKNLRKTMKIYRYLLGL